MDALKRNYGIDIQDTEELLGDINYSNIKYKITDIDGKKYIYKIFPEKEELVLAKEETRIFNELADRLPFQLPLTLLNKNSELFSKDKNGEAKLQSYIEGTLFANVEQTPELLYNLGKYSALLDRELEKIQSPAYEIRKQFWDVQHAYLSYNKTKYITDPSERKLADYFFDRFQQFVFPKIHGLRRQLIHSDLNDNNILVHEGEISGILDFGDACFAPLINELAIACAYMMFNKNDPFKAILPLIEGYSSIIQLTSEEVGLLPDLIATRLCISVCNSAEKKINSLDDEYVLISEKPAWRLLKEWFKYNPAQVCNDFMAAAGLQVQAVKNKKSDHLTKREYFTGKTLSLSYTTPIYMHSAAFQYMYDMEGNTYLDAYNNIPHIGHCHPKVSAAISRQVRLLNTNTRYLYDALGEYSEKLLSYFPEKLSKVFYVNSGSAASDLATRIAKNYLNRVHMLVLEHGYHGHTQTGINISSYKFDGKGGKGLPSNITKLLLPNLFYGECNSGDEYAEKAMHTINRLFSENKLPAALIAEPISGCGGQVPVAPGYFKKLQPLLEKHKILTIIDEVQTGFGRLGDYFWGFEMHGIIPDIVVLGKPMGNGHPIGAVITTKEVCDSFDTGMEFFSSFGGNPVSCEVAKTVLDVIEGEGLQKNAKTVGDYYIESMRELQKQFPALGDIRGSGLFLGFEFVNEKNEPDTKLAQYVKNNLKKRFVLTSTDGPFDNVIKSKPPLCFNRGNVDEVIDKFSDVLKSYKG